MVQHDVPNINLKPHVRDARTSLKPKKAHRICRMRSPRLNSTEVEHLNVCTKIRSSRMPAFLLHSSVFASTHATTAGKMVARGLCLRVAQITLDVGSAAGGRHAKGKCRGF